MKSNRNGNQMLGSFLVGQGFKPNEVVSAFNECDENFMPLNDVNPELFNTVCDFCDIHQIDCAEFLDSIETNELFKS